MKKIQNARILTNQQMKHISGGFQWQTGSGTLNGGKRNCPYTATGDNCKGICDVYTADDGLGYCATYELAGMSGCACIEK